MIQPRIRRHARERALQFLFGLDFTNYGVSEVLSRFWENNPTRPSVRRYAEHLIHGVEQHKAEIDTLIAQHLMNWRLERVGAVERNILRIAFFEVLHREDVPKRVAINEAIELAKIYGSEDSPRFVNGVLDAYCRNQP